MLYLYLYLYLYSVFVSESMLLTKKKMPQPLMFPTLMLSNQPTNQPTNQAAQHQSVLCAVGGVLCSVCIVYIWTCICLYFYLYMYLYLFVCWWRVNCVVVCLMPLLHLYRKPYLYLNLYLYLYLHFHLYLYSVFAAHLWRVNCVVVWWPFPPHLLPLPLFRSGYTSHTTFCFEIRPFLRFFLLQMKTRDSSCVSHDKVHISSFMFVNWVTLLTWVYPIQILQRTNRQNIGVTLSNYRILSLLANLALV